MTELENNFAIYINNEECKLGIDNSLLGGREGHNHIILNQGIDYGNRKAYSGKDERGVAYRIYWLKNERRFEDLFIDDPNYQGIGSKRFTIPKDRQFIHI